jgi:hypothetical protein
MTRQVSGEGVGGLEIAATGTECDASTYMVVSASVVDAGLSGMTIVLSENHLNISLTAMMRCTCERAQVRAYVDRNGLGNLHIYHVNK